MNFFIDVTANLRNIHLDCISSLLSTLYILTICSLYFLRLYIGLLLQLLSHSLCHLTNHNNSNNVLTYLV